MTYLQLMEFLETRLGYHQIPINPGAHGPKDLFEGCPLHDGLTQQLARGIFKRNRCQQLSDPVYQDKTQSVLAEIRIGVRQEIRTDIDRYNFIEDYCQSVHDFFIADHALDIKVNSSSVKTKVDAQIINFDRYRLRKSRWRA